MLLPLAGGAAGSRGLRSGHLLAGMESGTRDRVWDGGVWQAGLERQIWRTSCASRWG